MITGMMWFDNDPKKSLAQKIRDAAKYYKEKYKVDPTQCLVSMDTLKEGETLLVVDQTIRVDVMRNVLPGHIWIGIQEKGEKHE